MLWVHIADDGTADCLVNDGNKIRQGNPFDLFVVIGKGEHIGEITPYALMSVSYIKPNDLEYATDGVVIETSLSSRAFNTNDVAKLGSFFVNNKTYYGRLVHIPDVATTFIGNGGHISLKIQVADSSGDLVHVDNLSLYVMPTYGKTPTLITQSEYQSILNKIETHFQAVQNYPTKDSFPQGLIAQQTAGEILYIALDTGLIYYYDNGYVQLNLYNLRDGEQRGSLQGILSEADGFVSTALGIGTKSVATGSLAIGGYNDPKQDCLLTVGNGGNDDSRSNAFEVKFDGSAYLGKSTEDEDDDKAVATKGFVDKKVIIRRW